MGDRTHQVNRSQLAEGRRQGTIRRQTQSRPLGHDVLAGSQRECISRPSTLPLWTNNHRSNTESEFSWTGALPLNLFSGKHTFGFAPSTTAPGHTTFHDSEKFSGLLTSMMSVMPSMRGEQTSKNFDAFDQELKKRVESLYGGNG